MIPNRNQFFSHKQSNNGNGPWSLTREKTILWAWNDELSSRARGTSIKWQDVTVCDKIFTSQHRTQKFCNKNCYTIFMKTNTEYLKNQKIETGGKIDIPQELLDNALEAEKEEKPTESE